MRGDIVPCVMHRVRRRTMILTAWSRAIPIICPSPSLMLQRKLDIVRIYTAAHLPTHMPTHPPHPPEHHLSHLLDVALAVLRQLDVNLHKRGGVDISPN